MTTSTLLLTLHDLELTAHGERLLRISDLKINRGDCIILTGDNGSGKTTLMQALGALEKVTRLVIEVESDAPQPNSTLPSVSRLAGRPARRWLFERSVYLHQQAYMFDRSVRDNVGYGLIQRGLVDQLDSRVSAALEWSGLGKLGNRNARHLSGGEKQRVALTRARIVEPVLLLLDEPTGGLDRRSRLQTYALVKQLSEEGMTIIVSTHDDPANFSFARAHWNISGKQLRVSDQPVTHPESPVIRSEISG